MKVGGWIAAVLMLPWLWLPAHAAELAQVIRFNTACAYCHEGECSGRMSFALGADAAFAHIRRYAGFVDDIEAQQLVEALAHMKENCAYLPLDALASGVGDPAVLVQYRNPNSGDYFLPLGVLETGAYRLQLEFAERTAPLIEVINEHFDPVETCPTRESQTLHDLDFTIAEPAAHFVRLRLAEAVPLVGLRLAPSSADAK